MKQFKCLDNYFLAMSQGNEMAYAYLHERFFERGVLISRTIIKRRNLYNYSVEDTFEVIEDTFLICISEFRLNQIPFTRYCDFMLKRRITGWISRTCNKPTSLDDYVNKEETTTYLDNIESDDYINALNEINTNGVTSKIASKSKYKSKDEKIASKAIMLRYSGYTTKEICRKLRITVGRYRYILSKNAIKDELENIKIDLK